MSDQNGIRLIRHSFYNLLGLGLPLIAAIFCIPVLIHGLGDARFGLLTLIWAVVSYFGFFDFGLGRALTLLLSIAIAENENKRTGPLVATSIIIMFGLGVFAGILMASFAHLGVNSIQAVPNQQEAINAVFMMALVMPAIVLTSAFRGVLEARNAFGIINAIRLPMGLFTFIGPVIVITYGTTRLDYIAAVLATGRLLACVVHGYYAWRALPPENGGLKFRKTLLRPLFVSGGWLTLSNIISPFMGYIDRFIIGVIVSAAAIAFYTTPQEIVTKLWIVPGALTAVLFPAFATDIIRRDGKSKIMFDNAVSWLFLTLLPVTAFVALFAGEILSLWVGEEFALQSAAMMKIFAFGVLINCLAHIPYTLIQSAGQPRLTALLHLIQLPFFVLALWLLTSNYGAFGAAIAWLGRLVFDAFLMFFTSNCLQKWVSNKDIILKLLMYILLSVLVFLGLLIESLYLRALWLGVVMLVSWSILLKQLLVRVYKSQI
jgi:O-antigen/teichoic acid export membrane protein